MDCCFRPEVPQTFAAEGWLSRPLDPLPLGARAVVFAGAHSETIGRRQIEASAEAWGWEVVWFEGSAHFPFWEQPRSFSEELLQFLAPSKGCRCATPRAW